MTFTNRWTIAALCAFALIAAVQLAQPAPAAAAPQSKSVQTEAIWVAYDADAKTVTVKVTKAGQGKDAKLLKKNKEATFAVVPTGSVLTRTTVAINGVKGELGDIPAGKTVNVYWRPDEKDPKILRARKIDVIMSDEEIDEKYGTATE